MLLTELLIKAKKKKKKILKEGGETTTQDFILSTFEAGQISKEEAWEQIKKVTPKEELFFWEMELISAAEMMDDPTNVHHTALSKKLH